MPIVPIILIHIFNQSIQITVPKIESHILANFVEESSHFLIGPVIVFDDLVIGEEASVFWIVYETLHEGYIVGDKLLAVSVALLESDTVEDETGDEIVHS